MRHNDIMNFIAKLLGRECNDVETEPIIQPICGETMPRSAINRDEAKLDIRGRGFKRVNNANTDSARAPCHLKFTGNMK